MVTHPEEMTVLKNKNHEAFAAFVAQGESAAAAYRRMRPKASIATAQTEGPKLLRCPQVGLRVDELRLAEREAAEAAFKMERVDIAKFLIEVVKTPISEVNENHILCQEYSTTPNQFGTAVRYKMPSKLDAVEKLIKMAGYYAPEKVEHSGGVTGMFAELTGAKKETSNPIPKQ